MKAGVAKHFLAVVTGTHVAVSQHWLTSFSVSIRILGLLNWGWQWSLLATIFPRCSILPVLSHYLQQIGIGCDKAVCLPGALCHFLISSHGGVLALACSSPLVPEKLVFLEPVPRTPSHLGFRGIFYRHPITSTWPLYRDRTRWHHLHQIVVLPLPVNGNVPVSLTRLTWPKFTLSGLLSRHGCPYG